MIQAESQKSKAQSAKPQAGRNARERRRAVFSFIHHSEFITHHSHVRPDVPRTKTAFTLIELLVVIAIISLLVSILLPSLKKAKELARTAACAATMRSTGTAFMFYASDYDLYMPNAIWAGSGYRDHVSLLTPYVEPASGAYHCPSAEWYMDITRERVDTFVRPNYGLGYERVGPYSTMYNEYWGYRAGGAWVYPLRRLTDCKSPIVLLYCTTTNPNGFQLYSGGISLQRSGTYWQYTLTHDGEPNVLWHDGSVTMAYDNTELGYPNSQGETNTEFWDFAGDWH